MRRKILRNSTDSKYHTSL